MRRLWSEGVEKEHLGGVRLLATALKCCVFSDAASEHVGIPPFLFQHFILRPASTIDFHLLWSPA